MPCTYATDTYNVVLRWTAQTRIKYAPNPKLVGSKSHVRYAEYSQAKTVGEALKRGSYPLDLLFDHEKGHLWAVGGPVRDEPLLPKDADDSWTDADRTLAGMHQKWKTWTATFQVADRLGVDRRNLSADKLGGESIEMHAQRMEAQAVAGLILSEAERTGKKISDADLLAVLKLWEFKQSTTRQNVMKEGVEWVNSDTLGLLASYDGALLVSNSTKHYPAVPKIMGQWLRDNQPDLGREFCYTSINVNRGYAAARHRDGNNEGPSLIKAFGDFSGGQLRYWPEDNKQGPPDRLSANDGVGVDLRKNLLLFDGNRAHEVTDFRGERFTLVFFCVGKSWKATQEHRRILKDCGITVPEKEGLEWAKSLLSVPRGYGKAQLPKEKDGKEPFRVWKSVTPKGLSTVDLLPAEKVDEAKKASRKVEAPPDDDEVPEETSFVKHRFDRFTGPDGLKGLRLFLIGASGRPHFAVEGSEVKKGSGHFEYHKREAFPHGPPLSTHRLADVREWMAGVMQSAVPAGEDSPVPARGKRRQQHAEGEEESPKKRPRAVEGTLTSTGKAIGKVAKTKTEQSAAAEVLEKLVSCTEATKIKFRPVAKAAEASAPPKSPQRYAKYAKAKTLGEALSLGCSGRDLVHNVRHGLLVLIRRGCGGVAKSTGKAAAGSCGKLEKLLQQWRGAISAGTAVASRGG